MSPARRRERLTLLPPPAAVPSPRRHLTISQARRLALGAQGLTEARPTGRIDRRHVRRVFDRMGVLQVDSVNVLARSEQLPMLARLGPHPSGLVRSMESDGELFEYWTHEASLAPVELEPLLRWKMARAHEQAWTRSLATEKSAFVEEVYAEIAQRGPLRVSELSGATTKKGSWWGWGDHKSAVEFLFWQGRIAGKRSLTNFERVYDIRERVLPTAVLEAATPTEHDARKQLLVMAAGHCGVGTAGCLADYHRQHVPTSRALVAELVQEGRLLPVEVTGWPGTAYTLPEVKIPRASNARALLSPFDPVVWNRTRTEALWDFRYRIEIYVPAPKRIYGYYVLPFLLDEAIVARVDLKADRAMSTLRVLGAFGEPGIDVAHVASQLRAELTVMAEHLGLDLVEVGDRGDLATALRRA